MSWCDKVLKNSAKYWEKYSYPGISWGGETGVFIGGLNPGGSTYNNTIDYITISTTGNANDFGDSTQPYSGYIAGTSNGTRCIFGPNASSSTTCHQITFANKANSTAYGDLVVFRCALGAFGNKSRAVFGSGYYTTNTNEIDYFNLSTGGNASSFGIITIGSSQGSGASDDTRGLFMIGVDKDGTCVNSIHYVTISQTSNSMDFGDLVSAKSYHASCCCTTRVIVGYCMASASYNNEIDYVEISTLSNASQFGTIINSRVQAGACTNGLRAVFGGGYSLAAVGYCTTVEYLVGSTLGNPMDFGSLTEPRGLLASSSGN